MASFKHREHYTILIQGQPIEVNEEIYRIWLLSQNQERRHKRYYHNTYIRSGDTWVAKPAWMVNLGDYTKAYQLSSPEELEPESVFSRQYNSDVVASAIKTLPNTCRFVIELIYYHDLTQEAAAKKLEMSQPLLHYYKRKALRLLRQHLESQGFSREDFF